MFGKYNWKNTVFVWFVNGYILGGGGGGGGGSSDMTGFILTDTGHGAIYESVHWYAMHLPNGHWQFKYSKTSMGKLLSWVVQAWSITPTHDQGWGENWTYEYEYWKISTRVQCF